MRRYRFSAIAVRADQSNCAATYQALTKSHHRYCADAGRQPTAHSVAHVSPGRCVVSQMIVRSAHSVVVPTGQLTICAAARGAEIHILHSLQIPDGAQW